MLQVRADGQILDVRPKQEISLTFDNPFFETDHVLVSVSTPIAFPLTPQICRLFGFVPAMLMEPSVKKLAAELVMNGITVRSGTLVFDEYSDNELTYSFVGAEFGDTVSGKLADIEFPSYEDVAYRNLVDDGRSGACPDFGLPQIMRKEYAAQSEYRTSTVHDQYPECSATDKYANWLGTTAPFVVPAIRVNRILEQILPGLNIDDADIARLFDNLAILGLHKSRSADTRFGVIPKDNWNRPSDATPPGRCTLDLADTMPDMACSDFIVNLLKMTCSTLFCDGRSYHIRANGDILASNEIVDWTAKVADAYSCTPQEAQGYTLSFQNADSSYKETNPDDPDQQEEQAKPIEVSTMSDAIDRIKVSDDLVSLKHTPTGDIISGRGEQVYLYYKGGNRPSSYNRTEWSPNKTAVSIPDIAHQAGFDPKEISGGDSTQNYDCTIAFQVQRCVPTEIFYPSPMESDGSIHQLVGLRSMTPVIEIPTAGGTRPETVYIGLLLHNNFVDKGIYFTRPIHYMSSGVEMTGDLSLAIEGANGLYEKFHKTFAEWVRQPRSTHKIELNLSTEDMATLRLHRKYLLCNRTWFIKSLEVTLSTSSDSIAATAEIIPV